MERAKLEAEYRSAQGKNAVRRLRKEGKVPGVVYGRKEENISLFVNETDLGRVLQSHGESAIIDLFLKGEKKGSYNAVIRDVQTHPASGKILHVDFQRINLDEVVRVDVPIVLRGEARGVKEEGGILERGLRTLSISCVPTAIPENIEIDVGDLEISKSIHVKDLIPRFPEIEFLDDPESTLAIVVPPTVEVKAPSEEVIEEEAPAEPELIKKEKEKEEGAEEAEEGEKKEV